LCYTRIVYIFSEIPCIQPLIILIVL